MRNTLKSMNQLLWVLSVTIILTVLSCNHAKNEVDMIGFPVFSKDFLDKEGNNIQNTDSIINSIATNFEKGNYMEALTLSSDAYEFAVKNGDHRLMAILLNNIGLVHWRLNDFDAALEAYYQSALIAEQIDLTRLLSLTYTNRALILRNQGKLMEALDYNKKSIFLLNKDNEKRELGISFNNHGQIFKELRNKDSARFYYTKALQLYEEVDYKNGMSATYYNLSEIYTAENDMEKALEAARKSLELAIQSQSNIRISEGNMKFFEIYEHFRQPDSALKYYKIFSDLKMSMLKNNQSERILEYQTKFGNEVKNLKIQNLEKEKMIATGKIWFYSGSVLFFMLFVSFLIYRNLSKTQLKKRQLELELKNSANIMQIKERELKSYIIDLSKKNLLISDLQNQLQGSNIPGKEQSSNMTSLLNQKILTEDDWKIFKNKFSTIYPHFFSRIKILNIDLSDAEIRFLVLYRLKLTAKEMANTLGISLQSVRTCKMRLKRKLSVNHYSSVDDFIKKL